MPIVLDGGTVDYSLPYDATKPEADRPAFICKYLTCREYIQHERIAKQMAEEPDELKKDEHADAAIKLIVSGVKNMGGKTLDETLAVLTLGEKTELVWGALNAILLSERDKKKSPSRSQSTGDSSVKDAPAASVPSAPATQAQPS
jgi:hypothetical protein